MGMSFFLLQWKLIRAVHWGMQININMFIELETDFYSLKSTFIFLSQHKHDKSSKQSQCNEMKPSAIESMHIELDGASTSSVAWRQFNRLCRVGEGKINWLTGWGEGASNRVSDGSCGSCQCKWNCSCIGALHY